MLKKDVMKILLDISEVLDAISANSKETNTKEALNMLSKQLVKAVKEAME